MRINRAARRKQKQKKRRRLIAGMTGILSMATVSVSQLPTPTYGLYIDTTLIPSGASFSAVFLFPQTVSILAERSKQAAELANAELQNATKMLEDQQLPIDEESIVEDVYTQSELEQSVKEDVYTQSEPGQSVIEDVYTPTDTLPIIEPSPLISQIANIEQQLEMKNTQQVALQQHSINAHLAEEEAWAILSELNGYHRRAVEEASRVLLYLEPAIEIADQSAREATAAVSEIDTMLMQLENQISELQVELDRLMEDLRLAELAMTEVPVQAQPSLEPGHDPSSTPDVPLSNPIEQIQNPEEMEPDPIPVITEPSPEQTDPVEETSEASKEIEPIVTEDPPVVIDPVIEPDTEQQINEELSNQIQASTSNDPSSKIRIYLGIKNTE